MTLETLRLFAAGATLFGGALAGANLDRVVVQMPAWRRLDAQSWANYSRNADLRNGTFFYPIVAIAGAILTIVTAAGFYLLDSLPATARIPTYAAAILDVAGLLATVKAAPIMLSLRGKNNNAAFLQQAFNAFDRWTSIRAVAQILGFVANVWVLVALQS